MTLRDLFRPQDFRTIDDRSMEEVREELRRFNKAGAAISGTKEWRRWRRWYKRCVTLTRNGFAQGTWPYKL